jgi:hypothetical protein
VNRHSAFAAAATIAVLAGVVLGFRSLGGPGRQREISADEKRSADLLNLANAVNRWYFAEKRLPSDVNLLRAQEPALSIEDPITHMPYEYRPAAETSYQLCATFAVDSAASWVSPGQSRRFALHPAGRHCFSLYAGTNPY